VRMGRMSGHSDLGEGSWLQRTVVQELHFRDF
jgi:hypothetical protein